MCTPLPLHNVCVCIVLGGGKDVAVVVAVVAVVNGAAWQSTAQTGSAGAHRRDGNVNDAVAFCCRRFLCRWRKLYPLHHLPATSDFPAFATHRARERVHAQSRSTAGVVDPPKVVQRIYMAYIDNIPRICI